MKTIEKKETDKTKKCVGLKFRKNLTNNITL